MGSNSFSTDWNPCGAGKVPEWSSVWKTSVLQQTSENGVGIDDNVCAFQLIQIVENDIH